MKTIILDSHVSALKINPFTNELEYIDLVNEDTILDWIPENRTEVILDVTFEIGEKGKKTKVEWPSFSTRIVTNKLVHQLEDKSRLFVISHYDGWKALKLEEIVETNKYENYEAFVRGVSEYFDFEYDYYFNDRERKLFFNKRKNE